MATVQIPMTEQEMPQADNHEGEPSREETQEMTAQEIDSALRELHGKQGLEPYEPLSHLRRPIPPHTRRKDRVTTTHYRPIHKRDGRGSPQSASVRWRVLMVWALVLGCASAGTVCAGQSQVDICHVNGQGAFQLITIADPAFATHIAHGDKAVEHFFIDADGDGFGSSAMRVEACTAPEGFVADDTDCDDTNTTVHPGATEIEGNGVDDDCTPATPDSPTPTCPCEGITSNHITWGASFQTQGCFVQYHGHPVFIYDTTTTRVGILTVYAYPLDAPSTSGCFIGGAIDDYYVELREISPTTPEEHQACMQSLLHIAASDGVTCP